MKERIIKFLRWIAVPFAYLIVIILGFYLGNIIFNFLFADNGLLLFNNPKIQYAISCFIALLSEILAVILAMIAVGKLAPSHKIGAARTIATLHAALTTLALITAHIFNADISLHEVAGTLGILLGTIIGWKAIQEIVQ